MIPTGGLTYRNADTPYPFRFDSNFYYLTGFTEPNAWLVLSSGPQGDQSMLFCQAKDPKMEIWEGFIWGPDDAATTFGFDQAYDIKTLDDWMVNALAGHHTVWAPLGHVREPNVLTRLQAWISRAKSHTRGLKPTPTQLYDISPVIHDMRLIKDAVEQDLMAQSGQIAALAHKNALRMARPGLAEYQIEAEILKTFRYYGAQSPAYETIVATGANACILHHRASATEIKDGDLILIDAGCELHGYASDITRTFPANGRFSGPQADLYDIVLAAQVAAIAKTSAQHHFNESHLAAVAVITQGLIDLGILKGSLESQLEQGTYKAFYMHRTGHWLGLDVHDVGSYREQPPSDQAIATEPDWRMLKAGMVLTIEPGLYIRPQANVPESFWDIGIRIEDDALVTEQGCVLLTRDVPVTRQEIESFMSACQSGHA